MGMSLLPIQMAGTKHFERDVERDRSQVGCGPNHTIICDLSFEDQDRRVQLLINRAAERSRRLWQRRRL
jgi:hypothetical protein